jgi:hypothetical protein
MLQSLEHRISIGASAKLTVISGKPPCAKQIGAFSDFVDY